MRRVRIISTILISSFLFVVVTGCQKVREPVPILTQAQWQRIQENLLDEVPEMDYPVHAVFGDIIELLGYDLTPGDRIEAGEEFSVTWYWRVLQATDDRWEIFCHLDSATPHRQNLDHETVNGLYASVYWEPGQIIKDVQTSSLDRAFNASSINMFIGLWRPHDGARMMLVDSGQGEAASGEGDTTPRLKIGDFESYIELERLVAHKLQEGENADEITVDGQLNEPAWVSAPRTRSWVHPNSGEAVTGARTYGRALWDNEFLYVGLTARDQDIWATIEERDGDLWDEEVLEVYLDPGADGRNYIEIQINPLGTLFDAIFSRPVNRNLPAARARDVAEMVAAVHVNGTIEDRERRDSSWSAEFRIPWSSMPDFEGAPSEGTTIGVNFYRYDRPSEREVITAAWSPVYGGSFHQPDRFGQIELASSRDITRGRRAARPGVSPSGNIENSSPGEEATGEPESPGSTESSGERATSRPRSPLRVPTPISPQRVQHPQINLQGGNR